VARSGETAYVREVTDEMLVAAVEDPEHLDLIRRLGLRSVIIAALKARGRVFGTFSLASAESGRLFDEADLQLAEELAARAGMAIDNARLYTERSRIAHTLQVKLLPERLPEIPRALMAARYRAAGELNEVGGDFYDVFQRSPTEWAIVVGDVSGKGAEAAAVTALARYTLRAAALEDAPPSDALQRLNTAMLYDETSQFATVVMAYLSAGPDGSIDLRLALAGHPAPAVVRRDGSVEMVGRYGTIAGLGPDIAVHDVDVRLEADEVLLLYTDGVTEAGPRRTPFGEAGLVSVLSGMGSPTPQAVVDAVERAVVAAQPGDPRDDIALLAICPSTVVDAPGSG
jgi:serine phosphatase RsbU (regulator of sigma subunit)